MSKSSHTSWRRHLLILAIVVVLILGLAATWWIVTGLAIHDKAVADAKAAGIYFDLSELPQQALLPAAEDAGVDMEALCRLYWPLRQAADKHPLIDLLAGMRHYATTTLLPLDKEQRQALLADLDQPPFADALALTVPIAEKPGYTNAWDVSQGYIEPKYGWLLRDLIFLSLTRAILYENPEGTLEEVLIALRVSGRLHSDPLQLLRRSSYLADRDIVTALEVILSDPDRQPFSIDQLRQLRDACAPHRHPDGDPNLAEAFRVFNVTICGHFFQTLGEDPEKAYGTLLAGEPLPKAQALYKLPYTTLCEREQACFLTILTASVEAAKQPIYLARSDAPWDIVVPKTCVFLSLLQISSITECLFSSADHEARLAMAQTALEILIYRQEHDAYPTAEQLTLPLDPYSGKPLFYLIREHGFTLYSIGRDWSDNHGDPETDVVFSYDDSPAE